MILIDKYVDFLLEHKMTPNEFLLLKLLYDKQKHLVGKIKQVVLKDSGFTSKERIAELVKEGFLTKTEKGYKIGNKFSEVFVDGDVATDEIYRVYPDFITNKDGINIPLTGMDRETFKKIYMAKICFSVEEHKEVIKDIQYGHNKGLIKMGINKFLTSKQWEAFRKLRSKTVNTFDPTSKDY